MARKTVAVAQSAAAEFEPIVLRASSAPVERVLLFQIESDPDADGESEVVDYYIPKSVGYEVTLQYLEVLASEGASAAMVFQLRTLLGDEGYEALKNFKGLDPADFDAICEIADKIITGGRKGKSRRSGSATRR